MYQLRYTIPDYEWFPPTLDLSISSIEVSRPSAPSSWYTDNGWSGIAADELYLELNKLWQQQNYGDINLTFNGAPDASSYRYQISYDGNWNTATWVTSNSSTINLTDLPVVSGKIKSFKIRVQAYSGADLTGSSGAIYEDSSSIIYGPTTVAKSNQAPQQYQDSFTRSGTITQTSTIRQTHQDSYSGSATKSYGSASASQNSQSYQDSYARPGGGVTTTNMPDGGSTYIDDYVISAQGRAYQPPASPGKAESGFLVVTNTSTDPDTYAIAHKEILSLGTENPYASGQKWQYYTFGTSLYMPFSIEDKKHSAGFGFFVKDGGNTGYFIQLSTVPFSVSEQSKRVVAIYKVKGRNKKRLQDSQVLYEDAVTFVQASKPYEVNLKVKYTGGSSGKVEITAFINGYEISAIDDDQPLQPTKEIALVAFDGKALFDYAYAYAITEQKYESDDTFDMYAGSNLSMSLKTFFGDAIIGNPNMLEEAIEVAPGTFISEWGFNGGVEDFGSVAREIKKIKTAFEDRPGIPTYASIGINDDVTILAEKYNNFNAEVYVLNNTAFQTPLSDSDNTFVIVGNKIQKSGTVRYQEKEQNEYSKNEPVVFETSWIQNEKDIINLSTWLKNYWAKNNSTVEMEIFGNPLLMVGDVVTIDYNRVDLSSSQKFVIMGVQHDFNGGLTTSITCSSI